ncbi:hypothetical protein HpNP4_04410 [Helicobacter pylori]
MTYRELGKKVLEQAGKPLSVKEIFEKACGMGLDKERPSIGKTPWSTLGSDLRSDKKQFHVIDNKKPFLYWLKSREREFPPQETSNAEYDEQSECSGTAKKQKNSFDEENLHPLLVKFLSEDPDFRLLCKTIRHKECKKAKGANASGIILTSWACIFPIINIFPTMVIKKKL